MQAEHDSPASDSGIAGEMKEQAKYADDAAAADIINISDSDSDSDDGNVDDVIVMDVPATNSRSSHPSTLNKPAPGKGDVLRETTSQRIQQGKLPFPDGAVRLTSMKWQTKTRDEALSFAEILQPDKLRKALLTTFVLDLGWLMSHVKDSTKIVLVKSYNPQAERSGVLQTDSGNLTIVHPEFPRQRYPIMHSKVMLLFYDNYARFVASSANLIEIDWSVMQNIVFIQDVPFTPGKMQRRTEFKDSLAAALRDLSVPSQVVAQLDWMDFSKVKAHIVTSVPSSLGHGKLHAEHYGMLRLSQIVQNMQEQEQSPSNESSADPVHGDTQLCCYGSSMGNLRHAYLRDFFLCATGTKSSDLWKRDRAPLSSVCPNIKIGFHTDAQGESCIYGPAARTCIKFPKSYYLGSTTYPKDMLHKIEPKYANTLVHAKVMVARKGERQDRGWMYLGSHNFTAGAWGRLNKSGGISINNYEFGVVLPDAHFETKFGRDSVTWNGASVPMPFKLEWEPFGPGDIPCLSE